MKLRFYINYEYFDIGFYDGSNFLIVKSLIGSYSGSLLHYSSNILKSYTQLTYSEKEFLSKFLTIKEESNSITLINENHKYSKDLLLVINNNLYMGRAKGNFCKYIKVWNINPNSFSCLYNMGITQFNKLVMGDDEKHKVYNKICFKTID